MVEVMRRVKLATRASKGAKPVFDIEYFTEEDLDEVFSDLPRIKKFSSLFEEITRTIHAIPTIFEDELELSHVKMYLGRTAYLVETNKRHFNTKKLPYIIPVAVVKTDNVKSFEKWGISLIQKLQSHEVLCCGDCLNDPAGSQGPLPSSDESIIYIAFGFNKNLRSDIAKKEFAKKFANWLEIEGLFDEENYQDKTEDLESALEIIAKPGERLKLFWHINSSED